MTGHPSFLQFLGRFQHVWWFYAALLISVVETVLVLFAPQVTIFAPVRLTIGLGLLGYVPGYLTIRALLLENLSALERLVMSVFLSVAISVSIGIALGVGPFFQASNGVFALSLYTQASAILAAYQSYRREVLS
jgi:uncharacterized membrane protein